VAFVQHARPGLDAFIVQVRAISLDHCLPDTIKYPLDDRAKSSSTTNAFLSSVIFDYTEFISGRYGSTRKEPLLAAREVLYEPPVKDSPNRIINDLDHTQAEALLGSRQPAH